MISDTLDDALSEINMYLSDPVLSRCYSDPDIRREIDAVCKAMEALRERLDEAPGEKEMDNPCRGAT